LAISLHLIPSQPQRADCLWATGLRGTVRSVSGAFDPQRTLGGKPGQEHWVVTRL